MYVHQKLKNDFTGKAVAESKTETQIEGANLKVSSHVKLSTLLVL